jgi:hypothetical protein
MRKIITFVVLMATLSVVIPTAIPAMTVEATKCTTYTPLGGDFTLCSTQGKNPSTSQTFCSDSADPCTKVTGESAETHKGAAQYAVDNQQRCKQLFTQEWCTVNNGK